jgi:selenocysteine-specific elongation factor
MHVIGTAGHVDHGKSSLVQRLTGTDPDRLAEEKRRGLTIDLGFAQLTLPSGRSAGIVDVPGHERFIRNMLAGAGGINVCLFVVAANEGWKPQSAEHLAIVDVLGISAGVVAVTKSDAVDASTLRAVVAQTRARIEKTTLASAPVIPCSAKTGQGIDDLLEALDRSVGEAPPPADRGRPRLWIDRVFTIAGAGTVVTGTLTGGSFARGQDVSIAPSGIAARIRSIQSHSESLDAVLPGNRVALNLSGLDRTQAERGNAVVLPGKWFPTRRADARVSVVAEALGGRTSELTEKGAHLLYTGSAETPVRVKLLGTRKIEPGASGFAQIYLRDELPLERGDRFVLRDAGRVLTIGGGEVLDPGPDSVRDEHSRREHLARIDGASSDRTLRELIELEGRLHADSALQRSGAEVVPDDVARLGALLVSTNRYESLREQLLSNLEAHHAANPLERGRALELVRADIALPPDAFDALVDSVPDAVKEGSTLRLATHSISLDPGEESERRRLLDAIGHGAFAPPLAGDLAADESLLRALAEEGELVKVSDFYLTAERAAEAKVRIVTQIQERGPQTVAQIRDLLGTSRKYAVPLCEWLDASGVTVRRGDVRLVGPRADATS